MTLRSQQLSKRVLSELENIKSDRIVVAIVLTVTRAELAKYGSIASGSRTGMSRPAYLLHPRETAANLRNATLMDGRKSAKIDPKNLATFRAGHPAGMEPAITW